MESPPRQADPFGDAVSRFISRNEELIAKYARLSYKSYLEDADEKLSEALEADECPRGTLESFRILGVLGSSVYGEVFKAQCSDGLIVAIKVLDKTSHENKGIQRETIWERKLLLAMDSCFIVKLLSAFQDRHNLYLCMELASFGDLNVCIVENDACIEERLVRLLAAQVALALQYLHTCSIIHRDLKPANIMLFEDGYVKVGDFGLSKRSRKHISTFQGTPAYVAPEVIRRELYHCGVDWWSLGVTLYEMLFKALPFCGREDPISDKLFGVVYNELNVPAVFTQDACDLITQLLQKDVTKRLGVLERGVRDVEEHPWFRDIDFMALFHKRLPMRDHLPQNIAPAEVGPSTRVNRNERLCEEDEAFKEF